ncbi:glycosyltransferase family 8 protein [Sphingobacterium deserti]|uniref:Lipopolysaccharide biosynthesis glycosyltransferase n=1 Tax=Sphingobacterium deserti TaxID=1229276 RepID=A0A0B8T468_9SPHI|nr:glycosyltransferase family 8 protein [Sphingobacterium deserti]KGE14153.1 lipopolysaccharide biosynthesis glycosyltransferase [Sphingobacterium deserti]
MQDVSTGHHEAAVPIVLAFTPNYFVPVATCITSVLQNAAAHATFHFICLLTEALPTAMQELLKGLASEQQRFTFIDLTGALSPDIYVDPKYTIAASYRLLLPDLLPQYDKILYIDCDMIFRNDLSVLYRTVDLEDNYMAGVFEATLPEQRVHMEAIGCKPGTYINSGLLFMNLNQLRADKMVGKFLEAAKVEGLEFPDQDVINQLCKGRIVGLPPFWNSIRTFLLPQYKASFLRFYTEEDWRMVQSQGNVHYTGPKPWNRFTVAFDLWWTFYDQLPDAIKRFISIDRKLTLFARFYKNSFGKFSINLLQAVYRKLKGTPE